MAVSAPDLDAIIGALSSADDVAWIARRNKAWESNQWEVVRVEGRGPISDNTQYGVGRFPTEHAACEYAREQKLLAQAVAVQAMIQRWSLT